MSGHQLLSISHFWILGMITATLLLPPFKLVQLPLLQGLIAGLAIAFAVWTTRVQRKTLFIEKTAQKLRIGLHLYLGLVLGTILLNGLLLRFIY
jgi:heme A synthase